MLVCLRQGVGTPLSVERTRMLLVLRINVLAKGCSGISLETLDAMIKAFNGIPQLTNSLIKKNPKTLNFKT